MVKRFAFALLIFIFGFGSGLAFFAWGVKEAVKETPEQAQARRRRHAAHYRSKR